MSKEDVNQTEETVEEEVIEEETDDGEILEEEIVVTIETLEEQPQKSVTRKVLRGILVGGLMILGIMVIFASGFYTGAHVGGHGGGRSGGRDHKVEKVEPMEIETEEGYQNITTLPHVLTDEDVEVELIGD